MPEIKGMQDNITPEKPNFTFWSSGNNDQSGNAGNNKEKEKDSNENKSNKGQSKQIKAVENGDKKA